MQHLPRLAGIGLALTGLFSAPALAGGADRVDLTYRVFLGGIPVVEVDARTTVDGDRYRMDNLTRTVGLWESLFKARMLSRVDGHLSPAMGVEASPSLFQLRYDGQVGRRRSVDVTYDDKGPAEIRAEPPNNADGRQEVPPEFLLGAIDPGTAAMLAAEQGSDAEICRREFKIFDGRRRYDIAFENRGSDRLNGNGDNFYEGDAVHCTIRYRRVKGFDPDWERANAKKFPNEIDIWFVRFPELPRAVPVKVQVKTEYGVTVAQLIGRKVVKTDSLSDEAVLLPPPDLDKMGG